MKSKIFGIGLSRTGTTSLNNFLRELGYNVITTHMNKTYGHSIMTVAQTSLSPITTKNLI